MDAVGQMASNLPLALVAEDTLALIVVAAVAAAMIYLVATFAIDRARDRDDRRSTNNKSR